MAMRTPLATSCMRKETKKLRERTVSLAGIYVM